MRWTFSTPPPPDNSELYTALIPVGGRVDVFRQQEERAVAAPKKPKRTADEEMDAYWLFALKGDELGTATTCSDQSLQEMARRMIGSQGVQSELMAAAA